MHVLAMGNYKNVDNFFNLMQRKAVSIKETHLPPLNLSAWSKANSTKFDRAHLYVPESMTTKSNTTNNMIVQVFHNFLNLFCK